MGNFNANDFLDAQVNEPMSTMIEPIDEGEYQGVVSNDEDWLKVEEIKAKDGIRTFMKATVKIELLDEQLKQKRGRDKNITQRFQFFLDFDSAGKLDTAPEKNIGLGQLREATGLNSGPFAMRQLRGAGPFNVRIKQRADEKDPKVKYSEVARVAPTR